MNKKLAAVGVVVVVLLVVIWQLRGCSHHPATSSSESGSAAAHASGDHASSRGSGARAPLAPASLAGRVIRKADGGGVAGAYVSVARAELGALFLPDETPSIVVVTDATGAWSVPQIAPGTYTLGATASGLLPGSIGKLAVASGAKKTGVDLVLEAGGTLVRGTVTDIGGGPIEGARVTAQRDRSTPMGVPAELVTMTAADGTYQLTLGEGDFELTASDEDYAKADQRIEVAGQPLTVDFKLTPGATIRGRVVTQDDKPVPGALVQATSDHGARGQAFSDGEGAFVLKGLGFGAVSVTARARGYASASPTIVELGIGEQVEDVRVVVDRALMIAGHVVKKGTREGIPGVRLGVFTFQGGQALAVDPSDDDGYFEIHGVPPASYMAFAMGEDVVVEIGKAIEVATKDVTDVTIEMERGAMVRGRVEPAAVTAVALEIDQSKLGLGNLFEALKSALVRAESHADGTFELRNVPAGTFTVVARAQDGRTGKLPVVVTAGDQEGLVVRLEPRASIVGRVVDARGTAVAGVRVDARLPHGDVKITINPAGGSSGSARTAADGGFKLVGLDAGTYNLSVSDELGPLAWAHPVSADKPSEPLVVDVAKAAERTGLVLTVESRDGVIRGLVVGADRKPVADAWVTASLDGPDADGKHISIGVVMRDDASAPILTGADGRFALDHLRHGSYTIVVEGPRGASRASRPKVKTGETVTIALAPLGALTGRVTSGGSPVATYDVECDGPIDVHRRVTSSEGTYALERLAPGAYTCTATADAGTATATIEVPAGPAKLDLALTPYASITGVVVSSISGQPVAEVRVMAVLDSTGGDGAVFGEAMLGHGPMTDASGRFVIERQASGKGHLVVLPKDGGLTTLATRAYTTVAGQRADLGRIEIVPPRTGDAGTLGLGTIVEDGKLVVANVKPGGPAEQAGVKVGDRIVTIDGHPVTDLEHSRQLVASGIVGVGQVVQLGLDRAGTPLQISITAVKW